MPEKTPKAKKAKVAQKVAKNAKPKINASAPKEEKPVTKKK